MMTQLGHKRLSRSANSPSWEPFFAHDVYGNAAFVFIVFIVFSDSGGHLSYGQVEIHRFAPPRDAGRHPASERKESQNNGIY